MMGAGAGSALAARIATQDLAAELMARADNHGVSVVGPGGEGRRVPLRERRHPQRCLNTLPDPHPNHINVVPRGGQGATYVCLSARRASRGNLCPTGLTRSLLLDDELPPDAAATADRCAVPAARRPAPGW
jgi:hypothetical protein